MQVRRASRPPQQALNFPQHEGQEQAVKMRKKRPKARDVVDDEDTKAPRHFENRHSPRQEF